MRRRRVVIADDQPAIRAGVRVALEGEGFDVCAEARSAAAAVRAAKEHRPEFCLLDVHLPGGGVAAAAEIHSAVPETAVVMLTGSSEDDLIAALEAGARGYLLKDIEAARLPDALEAVMRGEVALPRSLVAPLVAELKSRDPAALRRIVHGRPLLTKREVEVLELLREGLRTRQIGQRLGISQVTVRRHVASILTKLGVTTRGAAVHAPESRS